LTTTSRMGSPNILPSRTAQSDKEHFSWIGPEYSAEDRAMTPHGRRKQAQSTMKQNRQSESKRSRDSGPFDLMDRKILSALRADGRLTMSELAEKVGLSQSPCWTRVKRLEASG